jgi:hypothetical protein
MDKRDNTLVWVVIALLGLIVVQMFGTLKIKEELKQCKEVTKYSNER